jgi:hypothetical protein
MPTKKRLALFHPVINISYHPSFFLTGCFFFSFISFYPFYNNQYYYNAPDGNIIKKKAYYVFNYFHLVTLITKKAHTPHAGFLLSTKYLIPDTNSLRISPPS